MKKMEKMKICSKCGLLKPLKDFKTSRYSKDGHTDECQSCYNQKYYSKNRYFQIRDIKCRKCREIYPDPFMTDIRREYDPFIREKSKEEGTCIFCKIDEQYSETIKLYQIIFSKIIGYKCPNPECNSIHFYNSSLSLDASQLDRGYIFSLPEKLIKTISAGGTSINLLKCRNCKRSYQEDKWEKIPEDKITESNYLKIKSKIVPQYPLYLQEKLEAMEKLIEIKDFNCSMNGVCGVLQKHHIALCHDPERLSSAFLLELISGKEAKENYLKSREKRSPSKNDGTNSRNGSGSYENL